MSIEASSHVWKHSKQSGSRLLLLVALADYTNAEGWAWPSIRSLCQRTRMGERYVQKMLRELEEAGEIEIRARVNQSSYFRVVGVNGDSPGEQGDGGRVNHSSPPLVNPRSPRTVSIEPSKESGGAFALVPDDGKKQKQSFKIPTVQEVEEHFLALGLNGSAKTEAEKFWNHHEARNWFLSRGVKMSKWRSAAATWKSNLKAFAPRNAVDESNPRTKFSKHL